MAKGPTDCTRSGREMKFLLDQLSKTAKDLGEAPEAIEGFPPGPKGNAAKVNGLYRSNWFNGRFLTADAFRADQVYADTRARMVAQIHPPGIAWGLTLDVLAPAAIQGSIPSPAGTQPSVDVPADLLKRICEALKRGDSTLAQSLAASANLDLETAKALCEGKPAPAPGGLPIDARIALAPGLAFDDLGRPISVGSRCEVSFTDLVNRYRTRPTVVLGGGTAFAPCACVEALPPEAVPPGAALPEGPYLLVITPIESPEGLARRATNPCAGRADDGTCDAEGWRGGFELSLSRLKIQVPVQSWSNAWDLRGLIAGWYFDVYEHDLRSRWNRTGASRPYYPRDPEMWKGPGPHARVDAAVPLALVYFGPDGTVWFVDDWIPRRPIASTASAAWADNVRGAPSSSARIARVHQFQTMLEQSLSAFPPGPTADGSGRETYGPNLYARGFRHIPPWGLLPVREPPGPDPKNPWGAVLSDALGIKQAREDAKAYFAGTNVFVHSYVALHDDDVLEDILRADQKDPITLRIHDKATRHADLVACMAKQWNPDETSTMQRVLALLLLTILKTYGDVTLDQLVNRELDAVKLFIPMDPARRELAVVGKVSSDPLAGLFEGWSEAADRGIDSPFAGLACAPRRFVVYVKHRMVLLEALYLAVDLVLDLMAVTVRLFGEQLDACVQTKEAVYGYAADSFLPRNKRRNFQSQASPRGLVAATLPLRRAGGETARVLLEAPGVKTAITDGLRQTFPELRVTATWKAYHEMKQATSSERALKALADEHQGFGVLYGASLVLPSDVFDGLVADIEGRSEAGDDAKTLAGATFHRGGYLREGEINDVAGALKDAYRAKPMAEIVARAPSDLKVGDVLDTPTHEVAKSLGRPAADALLSAVRRDADALLALAPQLAKSRVLDDAELYERLRAATAKANGDVRAGLEALAKTEGSKTAARELLEAARTLGADGTAALIARLERLALR